VVLLAACSIDFGTDAFYSSRRDLIDARLAVIRDGQAKTLLDSAFQFHGCRVSGLDWDAFTLAELQEIVQCVGGAHLSSLLGLLIRDMWAWSGGLPDLLLIRTPTEDGMSGQGLFKWLNSLFFTLMSNLSFMSCDSHF
jgi:hypothetical protein